MSFFEFEFEINAMTFTFDESFLSDDIGGFEMPDKLKNPGIPEFYSNSVISAFGRALLQHVFEYLQLKDSKITLLFDQIEPEVYFCFGSIFLEACRTRELSHDQRSRLKDQFDRLKPFLVHSETKQPYFRDPAERPDFSKTTSPAKFFEFVDAASSAAEDAAAAAAQSSSTAHRTHTVFRERRDQLLAQKGMRLVEKLDDLFPVIPDLISRIVTFPQNTNFHKTISSLSISHVRFMRILNIVKSILEKESSQEDQLQWINIEKQEPNINQLIASYTKNRPKFFRLITNFDIKSRIGELTGSPSGWFINTIPKHGKCFWKKFDSKANADGIVVHLGEKAKASSHQVKDSDEYLVLIKWDSISLEREDHHHTQEDPGAAAAGPSA